MSALDGASPGGPPAPLPRVRHLALACASGSDFETGLEECLARVRGGAGTCLRVTVFATAHDAADYDARRAAAGRIVERVFPDGVPPWSFVAQAPRPGADAAVHAEVMAGAPPGVRVRREELEGSPYTVVEHPGGRDVIAAGVSSGAADAGGAEMDAAFGRMRRILEREGLGFGDVVRQWGYVREFLRVRETPAGPRQVYQEFNDARRRAYGTAAFPFGYPAATGIGQAFGATLLEFTAVAPAAGRVVRPLSNPLQRDAHRYGQAVLPGAPPAGEGDKAAPLFERAKYVGGPAGGEVLVSGTAAIRAEEAVPGDAPAQARTTIENIEALVSAANLAAHGLPAGARAGNPSYVRCYVKRRGDIPAVAALCREAFGAGPAHFVTADVCRPELLVEIEGAFPVEVPPA